MYVAVKALSLLGVAFSLVSAADAPTPQFVDYPAIHQVVCLNGKGSAFEAGGKMISVNHVTSQVFCSIKGKPVSATAEQIDFSTVEGPARGYRIDCGGFKAGQYYWAIGYAGGHPFQRMIRLQGTGEMDANGMAILVGYPTVIPGMSGGIVMNQRGEAVGTVNMYSTILPISLSTQLKDTSLCR